MSQCVFCDAATNLNTQLTVALDDGSKVSVDICDTHAEDATVKTARTAYLDKQEKVKVLMEQAKALGFNLVGMQQQGKILVPQMAPAATPTPPAPPQETTEVPPILEGEGVIPTAVLDSRRMQSVGGEVAGHHVATHASHDLSGLESKLPASARQGHAKLTVVEAREGMPIAIPETRVDGTGTTRLRIVKKEDDTRLQSRFKKMAKDSIDHDKTPDFARSGYQNTQTDCPLCRGKCVVRQFVNGAAKDVTCPKCGGVGTISTV